MNIFLWLTVTYAKQIWDEMICPKDTKEEESLQASCDCNRGEEQELMRPDFRRGELNEGQVEMKVDDDAHSIVPESTSAYVQKELRNDIWAIGHFIATIVAVGNCSGLFIGVMYFASIFIEPGRST